MNAILKRVKRLASPLVPFLLHGQHHLRAARDRANHAVNSDCVIARRRSGMTRATAADIGATASAAGDEYREQHDAYRKRQGHLLAPPLIFFQTCKSQHYAGQQKSCYIPR